MWFILCVKQDTRFRVRSKCRFMHHCPVSINCPHSCPVRRQSSNTSCISYKIWTFGWYIIFYVQLWNKFLTEKAEINRGAKWRQKIQIAAGECMRTVGSELRKRFVALSDRRHHTRRRYSRHAHLAIWWTQVYCRQIYGHKSVLNFCSQVKFTTCSRCITPNSEINIGLNGFFVKNGCSLT